MTSSLAPVTPIDEPTSYATLTALLAGSVGRPARVRDDQLRALRRRWNAALSAQLDRALELAGEQSPREAVADAWTRLADQQPELRAVLDEHATRSDAESRAAADYEASMLAVAAGLVDLDDSPRRAAQLGGTYLAQIRGRELVRVAG
ncbi:MAG TPA: hypothetical protein VH008_17885 [Pseudonocardia sp.]|jgi:hypothetical protein|nr:hypothetical protein [Pseudonocardia sp.]